MVFPKAREMQQAGYHQNALQCAGLQDREQYRNNSAGVLTTHYLVYLVYSRRHTHSRVGEPKPVS